MSQSNPFVSEKPDRKTYITANSVLELKWLKLAQRNMSITIPSDTRGFQHFLALIEADSFVADMSPGRWVSAMAKCFYALEYALYRELKESGIEGDELAKVLGDMRRANLLKRGRTLSGSAVL